MKHASGRQLRLRFCAAQAATLKAVQFGDGSCGGQRFELHVGLQYDKDCGERESSQWLK